MFKKRLKELREEKNLMQKTVAENIGVSQPTYNLYENGKREPGFDVLIKLAAYFNVTTDYLIGVSAVRNAENAAKFETNEPILGKAKPHGYDYKPITWGAFLKLKKAAQNVADSMRYPVYLVGSALYKEIPRDIDISVVMPLNKYIEMFGELPVKQEDYGVYLGYVIQKSCNCCKQLIELQFCIDYHLDIKVCPDTWWAEKPKMLLAEPKI